MSKLKVRTFPGQPSPEVKEPARNIGLFNKTSPTSPSPEATYFDEDRFWATVGDIRKKIDQSPLGKEFKATVAMVLGSGCGPVAKEIRDPVRFSYDNMLLTTSDVKGHAGELIFGYLDDAPVVCLSGRVHFYQGDENVIASDLKTLYRIPKIFGAKAIIITAATGSLNSKVGPGELVLLDDHINDSGKSVLAGKNDARFGDTFVSMSDPYDHELGMILQKVAQEHNIPLHPNGTYVQKLGPTFETPDEIRVMGLLAEVAKTQKAAETLRKDLNKLGEDFVTYVKYQMGVNQQILQLVIQCATNPKQLISSNPKIKPLPLTFFNPASPPQSLPEEENIIIVGMSTVPGVQVSKQFSEEITKTEMQKLVPGYPFAVNKGSMKVAVIGLVTNFAATKGVELTHTGTLDGAKGGAGNLSILLRAGAVEIHKEMIKEEVEGEGPKTALLN